MPFLKRIGKMYAEVGRKVHAMLLSPGLPGEFGR